MAKPIQYCKVKNIIIEKIIIKKEKMNLKNIIPGQKMPDTKDIITCHIIPSYETLQKIHL